MADDDKKQKGAGVSRRGLFGVFTRGFAEAQETAKEEVARTKRERAAAISGAAGSSPGTANAALPPRGPVPVPRPVHARRDRPGAETLDVTMDASGRVFVDLDLSPLAIGGSWRLACPSLTEPIVFVRVSQDHYAACGGACTVDLSDLLWSGPQDVLWCPSCGSRWRLDGDRMRGPTNARLVSWHAEVLEGRARLTR